MLDILSHDALNTKAASNGSAYFQSSSLLLTIHIYVTSHKDNFEEYIPQPETLWTDCAPYNVPVSVNHGKPCFKSLLEHEKSQQIGALAVSVCGPGGLGDSVREAVRDVQGEKTVDLFEESFSW